MSHDLTTVEHWDETWGPEIRLRLPSPWAIPVRDLQRLLRRYVRQDDRVLEIGCAPGKILAWVAGGLGADVAGVDFSARGLAQAARLFRALRLEADLRQEDVRQTTFEAGSFDCVYSIGVIEHFDDPREIVDRHLELVRPGGTAVMTVPNYRGLYGRMQRYFDAESLSYHNLQIMSLPALLALAPPEAGLAARAYTFGRLSPWVLSLGKRWPAPVAAGVSYAFNAVALLQPFDLPPLSPMLVLEIRKAST